MLKDLNKILDYYFQYVYGFADGKDSAFLDAIKAKNSILDFIEQNYKPSSIISRYSGFNYAVKNVQDLNISYNLTKPQEMIDWILKSIEIIESCRISNFGDVGEKVKEKVDYFEYNFSMIPATAWTEMFSTFEFVACYSKAFKFVDSADDVGSIGKYAGFAKNATKNPSSSEVVLGKFQQDGVSYVDIAERRRATYFQLDNWNEVVSTVGEKNVWNINEQFLQQQMSQGKTFIFSHDPNAATGYFKQEVNFLKSSGYKFIQESSIWKAVK